MAGRGRGGGGGGRGRGRGMPAFMNKETKDLLSTHGIGRVDNVPPPVYDFLRYTKPQPLLDDIDQDYLTRKRQSLRDDAKRLPYQVRVQAKKKDVECYSDKYEKDHYQPLQPDWSLLPPELNITIKRRKRKADVIKPSSGTKKILSTQGTVQLEELEKNENEVKDDEDEPDVANVEKKKADGDDDDEEPIDEDDYDEAEFEEDNDYAKNYFESEDEGGDDDDNEGDAFYS